MSLDPDRFFRLPHLGFQQRSEHLVIYSFCFLSVFNTVYTLMIVVTAPWLIRWEFICISISVYTIYKLRESTRRQKGPYS